MSSTLQKLFQWLGAALVLGASVSGHAQKSSTAQPDKYTRTARSAADDIGKSYLGREIAGVFEVIQSLMRALKPDGRVVFVEYRLEDPKVPIKLIHKMSEAQIRKEAAQHDLVHERTARTLPWQHVVIFRKK